MPRRHWPPCEGCQPLGASHPRVPAYFLAASSVTGPPSSCARGLVQWSPVPSEDMLSELHRKREGEYRFLWEQKNHRSKTQVTLVTTLLFMVNRTVDSRSPFLEYAVYPRMENSRARAVKTLVKQAKCCKCDVMVFSSLQCS